MGNISKLDGPLSDAWNNDQIAPQHQILDRERGLGMHPIGPAFAGFVPKALQRIYPDAKLTEFGWNGFAPEYKNHILSPTEPCFLDNGKLQVQEWENEFGKCEYFLADSFNEMRLPTKTPDETNPLLEKYGDIVVIRSLSLKCTPVPPGW
jgi:alpha-N-acetylglucosaminidase